MAKMGNKPTGQWTPNESDLASNCALVLHANHQLSLAPKAVTLKQPVAFYAIGTRALAEEYAFSGDGTFQELSDLEYIVAEGKPEYEPLAQKPLVLRANERIFPVLFKDGTLAHTFGPAERRRCPSLAEASLTSSNEHQSVSAVRTNPPPPRRRR
jgi:hypothetical protein